MNRYLLGLVIACALSAGLLAADTAEKVRPPAPKTPTTAPTTQASVAVNKFCAIEQKHAVDPQVTIQYKGQTVGFCCEDCIEEFKKDPDKYVKNMK